MIISQQRYCGSCGAPWPADHYTHECPVQMTSTCPRGVFWMIPTVTVPLPPQTIFLTLAPRGIPMFSPSPLHIAAGLAQASTYDQEETP